MADKYLSNQSGVVTEVEGLTTSAGAADAGKIPALGADGKLDETVLPGSVEALSLTASETLAAGDLVYITGAGEAAKADATSAAKRAIGFVTAAVTATTAGTVYFEGRITGLSGLTPGSRYYLSNTTPGAVTSTPVTTAGHILQYVGNAISATELAFEAADGIVLA